jgi:hypothetical protein
VSRSLLSLYRVDTVELAKFSEKLRDLLARDDRAALSSALGLGEELARRVSEATAAIFLMLRSDEDAEVAPLFASLRRVAKRAALEHVWTSESPALEGRLRAYDVLREDENIAARLDRLLESSRLPWFFQRPGATGGWLDDTERSTLAERLESLAPALPVEVNAFAEALAGMQGDALVHDRL